jgi:hypothetical protein
MTRPRKTLADYPELAAELDAERNPPETVASAIPHRSGRKLWWRCRSEPRHHRWQAPVANRTRQPTCPFCCGRRVSPKDSLAARYPRIYEIWHKSNTLTPTEVSCKSTRPIKIKVPGTEMVATTTPASLTQRRRLAWQRRRLSLASNPVAAGMFVRLVDSDGERRPSEVLLRSNRKALWRCPQAPDHLFVREVDVVVRGCRNGRRFCPMCRGREVVASNCLRVRDPEIATQFDASGLNPVASDRVYFADSRPYWFRCHRGPDHLWRAALDTRTRAGQRGCPVCLNQKIVASNSLASLRPDLAAQWHPTRNGELTPGDVGAGSAQKVWWRCPVNPRHEFRAAVNQRADTGARQGTGCPLCSPPVSREQLMLFGALQRLVPELVYEKDDGQPLAVLFVAGWQRPFDAAIPSLRLFIEYDGYFHHRGEANADNDRRKNAAAEAQGWHVIRLRQGLEPLSEHDVKVGRRFVIEEYLAALMAGIRRWQERAAVSGRTLAT